MPKLTAVSPVLLVRDVVAAANHYRDVLGFTCDRLWGEPPEFCMVKRDGIILMLAQLPEGQTIKPYWQIKGKMWNAYFWVDDADGLHEELTSKGAKIDYGPCDQPSGIREFGIQDIDGHDIGFGQPM